MKLEDVEPTIIELEIHGRPDDARALRWVLEHDPTMLAKVYMLKSQDRTLWLDVSQVPEGWEELRAYQEVAGHAVQESSFRFMKIPKHPTLTFNKIGVVTSSAGPVGPTSSAYVAYCLPSSYLNHLRSDLNETIKSTG